MRRMSLVLAVTWFSTALVFAEPLPDARAIIAVPCYHPVDVCVAAFRYPDQHHRWQLLITGPKRLYFRRYRLCVQAPDGSRSCDVFRVLRTGHHHYFFSNISWGHHFPSEGRGQYSVRWRRLPSHRLVGKSSFIVG